MDPREKWICPLCRTGHPNERSSVRAYLSVCEIFLQTNVEARIQLINKHKYCKLCTMNLANKTHQTSSICPKTDRFKCSNCTEPKSLTHCSLLCLANQRNHSTRGRPAQRNPGHGRGGSRGRQPGSGHPHQVGLTHLVLSLATLLLVAVDKVTSRVTPSGTMPPSTTQIGKKL